MTSYKLKFLPVALKEWKKLGPVIREQLKKKLKERLRKPRIDSAKLSGYADAYKIKLRSAGYRLAYIVIENEITVVVVAVGKRENNDVYEKLNSRL